MKRMMYGWLAAAVVFVVGCGPPPPPKGPAPAADDEEETPSKQEVASVIDDILSDDGEVTTTPAPEAADAPEPPSPTPTSRGEGPSPTPAPAPATTSVWRPGVFMQQALHNLVRPSLKLMNDSSFGFEGGTTIIGAFLHEGKQRIFRRNLEGGKEYVFIGAAGNQANDIDLHVIDENGKRLAGDTDDDGLPVVKFKPPKTGSYGILIGSAKGTGFIAFSTMCDGCLQIPPKRIDDAVLGITRQAGRLSNALMKAGQSGLVFSEQDWAFFSTVLDKGEQATFGVDMAGQHVFMASGDESTVDIDLVLADASGKVLREDKEKDAVPGFRHTIANKGRYQLVVQAPDTKGKSLVSLLVLSVEK